MQREITPDERADRWEVSDWQSFRVIWPRRIDGRWRWLSLAERRTVYVGGAMGLCCDMWRMEYRSAK